MSDSNSKSTKVFPPGVSIAFTRNLRDILREPFATQLKSMETELKTFSFAPSKQWLAMFASEDIPTVVNPTKQIDKSMSTWIGITTIGADAFRIENSLLKSEVLRRRLKRAALLFDRVAIYDLVPALSVIPDEIFADELRWAIEQDIICQPEVEDREYAGLSEEYIWNQKASQHEFNKIIYKSPEFSTASTVNELEASLHSIADAIDNTMWWQVRGAALWFREVQDSHVIPVLENSPPQILRPKRKTGDVINIIIKTLPMPSDEVSWSDLLTYKNDPETRRHLVALRNWANETARLDLTPPEVADKLEGLIEKYKSHMKLHELKFKMGRAELILTTVASAAEELTRFRFGSAAKLLFDLKRNRVGLLEAEINSPGSEVAYIVKSGQTFEPE